MGRVASSLKPGESVILPDGRMFGRDEDGGFFLAGDDDIGVTPLDDPSRVCQLQRRYGLPVTGIADDRTRLAIRNNGI